TAARTPKAKKLTVRQRTPPREASSTARGHGDERRDGAQVPSGSAPRVERTIVSRPEKTRYNVPKRVSTQGETKTAVARPKEGRSRTQRSNRAPAGNTGGNGAPTGNGGLPALLEGLRALEAGDFDVRLALDGDPLLVEISDAFNRVASLNRELTDEVVRVSTTVGREGQMSDRATLGAARGGWETTIGSMNTLITDLMQPTTE